MSTPTEATVENLYQLPEDGKAEIVNGELVIMPTTGFLPHRAGLKISMSLYEYEQSHGGGYAIGDNAGFIVSLPNRRSFSPYAALYKGEPSGGKFLNGAPVFAVEVRSEGDYGAAAEQALAAKRADYFAAGAQVVWDVDVLRDKVVRVYRADDPGSAAVYCSGDVAEAEPAVPGWKIPVDSFLS